MMSNTQNDGMIPPDFVETSRQAPRDFFRRHALGGIGTKYCSDVYYALNAATVEASHNEV